MVFMGGLLLNSLGNVELSQPPKTEEAEGAGEEVTDEERGGIPIALGLLLDPCRERVEVYPDLCKEFVQFSSLMREGP